MTDEKHDGIPVSSVDVAIAVAFVVPVAVAVAVAVAVESPLASGLQILKESCGGLV